MHGYSTAFFVGFLIAFVVMSGINAVRRRKKYGESDEDYDERQQLVRYKGFRMALFVLIFVLVCMCLIESIAGRHIIDMDAATIIGICISVGVHVLYCIWNEGYFPVNYKRKSFIIMSLAMTVLFICFSMDSIESGEIIVDGVLTGSCGNLVCAVLFALICIVNFIKLAMEKKEDEQQ